VSRDYGMENKSFFLSICYLLLPCCFSPVFVKASREAQILRGRSEQGSAAWELPLPPSDFDPPVKLLLLLFLLFFLSELCSFLS
jgi:hypothetical protein